MTRSSSSGTATARALRLPLICVAVVAISLAAACSSSGDSSGSDGDSKITVPAADWVDETGKGSITIITKDNNFTPEYVKVSPGTKIVFDNKGRTAHNVIPSVKDQFESIPVDDLQPGDKATLVIDDAGEYPYYCSLHGTKTKGMIGGIEVVE